LDPAFHLNINYPVCTGLVAGRAPQVHRHLPNFIRLASVCDPNHAGVIMAEIDDTDLMLIELLQKDARTPQHELAKIVGLAASSVNEGIRKLGERGLITGYHARISPDVFGYDLLAFVYVGWSRPETEKAFLKKVLGQSTVMEIHHVTGTWNYMLKVRVKNTRMLEGLLAKVIKSIAGVERTETIIVLSSLKETAQIPTREPEWM
jgi:Lrp/AsnC family leucine-responsive transcriptional regulator